MTSEELLRKIDEIVAARAEYQNVELNVTPLVAKGQMGMTNPSHPKSADQKYYTV